MGELIETRVPTGRAHVVGLSFGGSVVLALLDRHPDRIDRAVVDGSGVLSSWVDPLVVLGAEPVSPIAGARPMATLLGPIGLRGLGIALRGASPAATRRVGSTEADADLFCRCDDASAVATAYSGAFRRGWTSASSPPDVRADAAAGQRRTCSGHPIGHPSSRDTTVADPPVKRIGDQCCSR